MSPEAKLVDFARRIHLQEEDVDYLISLLQEARGLGAKAGWETVEAIHLNAIREAGGKQ